MDAINFACFMEKSTKSLNIQFNSDLIEHIFDIYEASSYENYTLLELLNLLIKNNYEITVPWNKTALINMIEERKIDIPTKMKPMQLTQWTHTKKCIDADIDTIHTPYMDIYKGFMFQDTQGHMQLVTNVSTTYDERQEDLIWLQDITSEVYTVNAYLAKTLISQFDKEDITIIQHRDYDKFLNVKEKKRWTLYYMRVDDPLYNIVKNS